MSRPKTRILAQRMSITVPGDLKRRMDRVSKKMELNWSAEACRGFEARLGQIEGGAMKKKLRSEAIEIRDVLIRSAMKGETITYQEAINAAGLSLNVMMTQERNKFGSILAAISKYEHGKGRPLLSAIVVNKGGYNQGKPGPGFFALAIDIGRFDEDQEDPDDFAESEKNAVFTYWRQTRGAATRGQTEEPRRRARDHF